MTDKPKLIDPRLPRGFEDRLPGEIAAVDAMLDKIRAVYERYGFEAVGRYDFMVGTHADEDIIMRLRL